MGQGGLRMTGIPKPLGRNSYMENWYVYDYNGGSGSENVFYPVEDNIDYVTADDTKWRIDTPENPDSVLPLIRYQQWLYVGGTVQTTQLSPINIVGATVRFDLRGDGLDLKGGSLTFWILSDYQRWHNTNTVPTVSEGSWTSFELLIVDNDAHWHNSWLNNPGSDTPDLTVALGATNSYGVAFIGFSSEPTGAIDMRNFNWTFA